MSHSSRPRSNETNKTSKTKKKPDPLKQQKALKAKRHKITEELEHRVFALERECDEKREVLKTMKEDIARCQGILLDHASQGGPDSGTWKAEQRRLAILRKLDVVERQLQIESNQKNAWIGRNIKLKQEINDLRTDKVVFTNAFKRFDKQLEEKRQEAAAHQEVLEEVYSGRDKAQVLCAAVLQEFMKRKAKLGKEAEALKEAERAEAEKAQEEGAAAMDPEAQYREVMGLTGDSPTASGASAPPRAAGPGRSRDAKKKGRGKTKGLRDRIRGMTFSDGRARRQGEKMQIREIGYYADLWNHIQSRTGLSDVDQLAMVFVQMEEIKMQKLTEASSIISDMKTIARETKEMEAERDALVAEKNRKNRKQKQFLVNLQRRVESVESEVDKERTRIARTNALVQALFAPAERLRRTVVESPELPEVVQRELPELDGATGADPDAAGGNLFAETVETQAQLLEAFAAIERRATELTHYYLALRMENKVARERERAKDMGKGVRASSRRRRGPAIAQGPATSSGDLQKVLQRQQDEIVAEVVSKYPPSRKEKESRQWRGREKPLTGADIVAAIKKDFARKTREEEELEAALDENAGEGAGGTSAF
jgi:hypothetical protein